MPELHPLQYFRASSHIVDAALNDSFTDYDISDDEQETLREAHDILHRIETAHFGEDAKTPFEKEAAKKLNRND